MVTIADILYPRVSHLALAIFFKIFDLLLIFSLEQSFSRFFFASPFRECADGN